MTACREETGWNTVKLWCHADGGMVSVSREPVEGADEIVFTLWELSFHAWNYIDGKCYGFVRLGRDEIPVCDYCLMRELYLRLSFRSWNLDEEMRFGDDGVLDDESHARLMRLHPKILRILSDGVFADAISEEDDVRIGRQASQLFGKGGSVQNPHPMISLYATLSEMWSKFGLNYFDLKRLPMRERNVLRRIASIENQIRMQELDK